MINSEQVMLGRTGLHACRLGISTSFGAPAKAYEMAFERGCNYFTWGTFIKGRSKEFKKFAHSSLTNANRDKFIIAFFSYAHEPYLTEKFLIKGLKELRLDYIDILLLGYFPKRPKNKIIDGAIALKDKGLIRHIGLSSHNRKLFAELSDDDVFDIFHLRYNAANRGAEEDVFPYLNSENRPGIVSFTATRWRQLLNPKKMPQGEEPLSAVDCYRFVLANPAVDICMMGAKNEEQMAENLKTLDYGPLTDDELERIKKIGRHVYGK